MKNDQGFTLIETIMAMALLGLVLITAYSFMFSGLKSWTHGEDHIDVMQNLRAGMDLMIREIRMADAVKTAGSDKIVITVPNTTFSAWVDICYRINGNELEKQRGSDGFQPVVSRISGLSFAYDPEPDPNHPEVPIKTVTITMTGKKSNGSLITLKSKVSLRSVN
ncbi:PilW family protein [Candidatus Formimonas warabiya]|uniref:Prepilin-type N-terminal cleavage/methylation domain-containing protein n=1 Tax=Formimonas warabiya TaxID=1761012 RepID=A0A3G1KNJ5_FORW1|nr:prepilin-type N-terminal cleavage/methylation domain-containing protein [Candidatus Formimonas warabiya]ATW23996.1 hypothetical protein DCMF_03600 [Candidatus Formimonas warabiya]